MKKPTAKETVHQGDSAGRAFYEAQASSRTPWAKLTDRAKLIYDQAARARK